MTRTLRTGAALAALLIAACGPSRPTPTPDGGNTTGDGGSTTGDGGSTTGDGGTTADGGSTGDGGLTDPKVVKIAAVRSQMFYQRVIIENVVVHTIDDSFTGNPQPDGGAARCTGKSGSTFWVVDPQQPVEGIQVVKDCEDLPTTYVPAVGDLVTIEGYYQTRSQFDNPDGRRPVIRNEFAKFPRCNNAPCPGKVIVTKNGTAAVPAPNVFDGGQVPTDGGRPTSAMAGTRVYVPGPVTLTNPRPQALKRISAVQDDDRYFGFEITGGILVSNYKTFGTTRAGGAERCDWNAEAIDGGQVSFPAGVLGVWDTYTFAPCQDGGVDQDCFKTASSVPGTGFNSTYIVYPQGCFDFVDGGIVTR